MVFNVLAVNQDDHVKNISFLVDQNGIWTLSPACDITFACDAGNKWLQVHQMTINGKKSDIRCPACLRSDDGHEPGEVQEDYRGRTGGRQRMAVNRAFRWNPGENHSFDSMRDGR